MNSDAYFSSSYWWQVDDGVDEESAHELALWDLEPNPEAELDFDEPSAWD
jgi:hypothetical protein